MTDRNRNSRRHIWIWISELNGTFLFFGTDRDRSGSELSWIETEAEELL